MSLLQNDTKGQGSNPKSLYAPKGAAMPGFGHYCHAEPYGPNFANTSDFSRENINPDFNVNFSDFTDWQWINLKTTTIFKC